MIPSHIHGPNCGCKDYAFAEDSEDLLSNIMIENIICLNEEIKDSCKKIFKAPELKFDKTNFLSSCVDAELLLIIPFDSIVKLKTINIIAKDEKNYANKLKIFSNKESIDFEFAQENPGIQEFDLGPNLDGKGEMAVKQPKFSSVSKLILYISNNNLDKISISYICIKGIKTNMKQQIVKAVYESKPMLADHKDRANTQARHQID